MNRLSPRPHLHAPDSFVKLVFRLSLALCVGPPALAQAQEASDRDDPSFKTLPAWTWIENCHVQRGHQLTDFGTFGSLVTSANNQTIFSHPFAGKNSTGVSFLGTIKQDLWSGGALIAYLEARPTRLTTS